MQNSTASFWLVCFAAVEKVREGARWSGTLSFSPLTSIKTGMWWKERMGHKSFRHPINSVGE